MILTDKIKIKVSKRVFSHYKHFYNNIKINDIIYIKPEELSIGSHVKILVKCDFCDEEKYITYKNYVRYLNKDVNNKYTCNKCNYNKRQKTCLKKYGVDNVAKSEKIQNKAKKTNLKKYGVEHYFQSKDFKDANRKLFISLGFNVRSKDLKDWNRYQRYCMAESYKNYKELKTNWDGYDYYDDEYIKENYKLDANDPKYPTIDHKNSIIYGFINNISPDDISAIDNLCITKRTINSMKRHLTENDFRIKFNINKKRES